MTPKSIIIPKCGPLQFLSSERSQQIREPPLQRMDFTLGVLQKGVYCGLLHGFLNHGRAEEVNCNQNSFEAYPGSCFHETGEPLRQLQLTGHSGLCSELHPTVQVVSPHPPQSSGPRSALQEHSPLAAEPKATWSLGCEECGRCLAEQDDP